VRHHGETARIEIQEADISRFLDPEIRVPVTKRLRHLGTDMSPWTLRGSEAED